MLDDGSGALKKHAESLLIELEEAKKELHKLNVINN